MLHDGACLDHNHSQPRVGVKHGVALKRVRLQEHRTNIRRIIKLLQDSSEDVEETQRPSGTQSLPVCITEQLRSHLRTRCLGEQLPNPGHLVALLEARTMLGQVKRTLLQGIPHAFLWSVQHI